MNLRPALKWTAGILLALALLLALLIAVSDWNWLRGPIERMALERTGRVLRIAGDLDLQLAWPLPRLRAGDVTFANPDWATEAQMLTAAAVELSIDLPQLLQGRLNVPELRLDRPVIYLEQGSGGRRNWLLDRQQQDEAARLGVGRLSIDRGQLGYDDAAAATRIRAAIATSAAADGSDGLDIRADGKYKGMVLKAQGRGDPVLALGDTDKPYRLRGEISVGATAATVDGSITSLVKFTALDMRMVLRGTSLAQLYPLLGVAFPETRAYSTAGHLVHAGQKWRYAEFSGRIGDSDVAGDFRLDLGGKRPAMQAKLVSRRLDLADLGALIGSRPGRLDAARQAAPVAAPAAVPTPKAARLLPDLPFRAERWDSVDAAIDLDAASISGAGTLKIDRLRVHLDLRDAVLKLDPLGFDIAGGHLDAALTLDGRQHPIRATLRGQARKMQLGGLVGDAVPDRAALGRLDGEFALAGSGNAVGEMLGSADGKVALIASGGSISRLTMEKAGLHLWEILELRLRGDRPIKLHCGVADFAVEGGRMDARALVFDTEITTIIGTGSIDLRDERLDLTLNQKTKDTSPLALRSPIHVRGTLARPTLRVDPGRIAARALGALALGLVNPLLLLLPLIDAGPGQDSDCGQLIRDARARPSPAPQKKAGPRT